MPHYGYQVLSPLYIDRQRQRFDRTANPVHIQNNRPVRLSRAMKWGEFKMPHDRTVAWRLAPIAAATLALLVCATIGPAPRLAPPVVVPPQRAQDASRIVAVVNGDVISNGDVEARTRLFALSTGLPMS